MIIFNSVNYICHNRAVYFRILNTSIERIWVVASKIYVPEHYCFESKFVGH